MQDGFFEALTARITSREPETRERRRAAVAVILSERTEPKVLLIERPERKGDPWSGQIAFPGGKFQEGDASAASTAAREAREEVGIDLGASAVFLGYLGAFRTHAGDMEVVPAVFLLKGAAEVTANEEAASFMWVPLAKLSAAEAKSEHEVHFEGETRAVPAFKVGRYVVWGLTYRILVSLIGEAST